jgi:hypothetical protein
MGGAFYLALMPWLTFAAADRSAGLKPEDGALIATTVAVAICANHLRLRERSVLSIFAVAIFATLTIVTITVGRAIRLGHEYRAIIFAALSLYLFGTLSHRPVTLTYASHALSPSRSVTPAVRKYHGKLTLQWASAIGGIAVSFTVGIFLHGQMAATVFNWFIPMALIVVIISVPSGPSPNAGDELSSVLGMLDSFKSRPVSNSGYPGVSPTSRALQVVEAPPEAGNIELVDAGRPPTDRGSSGSPRQSPPVPAGLRRRRRDR